jgi:hypothetical protein
MPAIVIRGVVYLLIAIALGEGIRLELELAADWRPFTEFGYLQIAQSLFLFACTAILALQAVRGTDYRELAVCMSLFFLALLIRENDQPLELIFPHGAWKYFAAIPLTALLIYAWKNRRELVAQAREYSGSFAFGVMLSGMLVLTFSRLFGRTSFWERLMGDTYLRKVKMVAEEGIEFLALGMVLVAVVEFMLLCRTAKRLA